MKSLTKKLAAVAILAAVAGSAVASVPAPIKTAENSGMKVEKTFKAASGLTGYVLGQGGHHSIVFVTPDQKSMLIGALVDASGRNLTADYAKNYIPAPNLGPLYSELERAENIKEGAAHPKSVVYAFFDANCIFCHLAWKALQPYEKVGLQVRWVPVAFLKPTSATRAAAILGARNRAAALELNESRFNANTEDGGIKPANVPANVQKELAANGALMQKFGSNGTPAFVWKDRAGHVQFKGGMPRLSEIPGMTGLPAQANHDKDLARFQ